MGHGARSDGSVSEVQRLWSGQVPLERAFWTYAVAGGLVVNLATSLLFLILVSSDFLLVALVTGYGLSVPYNLVALVGVWRAADRYEGDRALADVLRMVTLVGMLVLTVT